MTESTESSNLLNLFTEVKDTVIRRIRGRKKDVALVLSTSRNFLTVATTSAP